MIAAGIDMGARSIKVVIVDTVDTVDTADAGEERRVLARHLMFPESLDMDAAAERAYADAIQAAGLDASQVRRIVATGVARKQARFAHDDVTEVASGGRGAAFLFPTARTVVDVGAEEARAIRLADVGGAFEAGRVAGRVADFAGNEKCAAGAGAFAESMARALQLNLAEFGAASLRATQAIPMNAQCTVFAESEVVSLIHAATPVEDIARAVLDAVASRVCAMARRVGIERDVVLIGGMAHNPGFNRALQEALGIERLLLPEHPEHVAALGAALIAADG